MLILYLQGIKRKNEKYTFTVVTAKLRCRFGSLTVKLHLQRRPLSFSDNVSAAPAMIPLSGVGFAPFGLSDDNVTVTSSRANCVQTITDPREGKWTTSTTFWAGKLEIWWTCVCLGLLVVNGFK